jgi:hypothetical protein
VNSNGCAAALGENIFQRVNTGLCFDQPTLALRFMLGALLRPAKAE